MLDRASVVDEQFITRVKQQRFPKRSTEVDCSAVGLSKDTAIEMFDSQIKSRLLDVIARQLKEKGLSYYTIGSSGHEGNAVFGEVFRYTDMGFLHYRSGAFFIQRAKQIPAIDSVKEMLSSLVASATDPISGGRHKVVGSLPLTIPPQTSTIASHLPKALGTAISLTRAKELAIVSPLPPDSVILCSFGDASINHAVAQTTFNACAWIAHDHYPVPLVFICEDNGFGISVRTPQDWVYTTMSNRPGIHYLACDGLNIADCYAKAKQAEQLARVKKQPVFLHMRCVRLLGHAGSDIESQYRTQEEIDETESHDPLLYTAGLLCEARWLTPEAIVDRYQTNRELILAKAMEVLRLPKLGSAQEIMASILPPKKDTPCIPLPNPSQRRVVYGKAYHQLSLQRNLSQQINFALTDLLLQYPNMVVFGEDVGKKGGVYRVTADLQARFGQRRVFDTLLDETTILGTAIGLAHNGFLPVPEIQFLAYVHNAEDQIRGEAATLSFFSNGQYQNPMIVRIAALGYQKGFGGHFHNDNSIAVFRDLPGVVVACPSNGPDAAKMLRTCVDLAYHHGRVVIFLEPIALYMQKDLHVEGDNGWLFPYPALEETIADGEVGVHGTGELVILSYANGYYLSRQAAKIVEEEANIRVKVVDLRWLSPLPAEAILREVCNAKHVLIVDEGRRCGSLSEGLMALLLEEGPAGLKIKRITGEDSFIPLGGAWQYVLPNVEQIKTALFDLSNL